MSDFIKSIPIASDMVSLWIPSGTGRVIDIIRGNHGQCDGTHPNVRVFSKFEDAELVTNGDMEDGFTGGLADGWNSSRGNTNDETSDVHGGSHAQELTNPAGNSGVVYQGSISLITGKRYRISTWAKKSKGSGGRVTDSTSTNFPNIPITSATYVKLQAEFTAVGNMTITFYADTNASDDTNGVLFDDVLIEELVESTLDPSLGWHFDGTDDYIAIPHHKNQLLTSGLTAGAWIKPDSVGEIGGRIIDKSTGQSAQNGFLFCCTATDRLLVTVNGGTQQRSAVDSVFFGDGNWYCVGVTIEADATVTFYVNGSQSGTPGATGALSGITTTNAIRLGNRSGATDRTFDGYFALPFIAKGVWSLQQHENFYLHTKGLFAPR